MLASPTSIRYRAPAAAGPSFAPLQQRIQRQVRSTVRVRDSKDAAAELDKFSANVRDQLTGSQPPSDTVPVMMSMSMASVDSMGSKDGLILELDKDTFYPYLAAQGDALVVVDFYTQWCGPCKAIYPKLKALSEERTEVRFVKFDCNKNNKEIGQALGIKVAPTFFLYRNNQKLASMTGADINKLVKLIDEHAAVAANA